MPPVGSIVHKIYSALLRKGYVKAKAARIAQSKSGQVLATGKRLHTRRK